MKLIFKIYDFDNDGLVTQTDIITLISCMPVVHSANVRSEGKYTKEGGGVQSFQDRVDTLEEMLSVLQHCFGEKKFVNFDEFAQITENVSSDMVLSVLSLLRERLPCSENYWRYRRNFEIQMKQKNAADPSNPGVMQEMAKPKVLAPSHLSFVKNLSQYSQGIH